MKPEVLEFMCDLAQKTGRLLSTFFNSPDLTISRKPDGTVVTHADLAANNFLCEAIQKNFPHDGILSEETNTVYLVDSKAVWIIDPLDGTTNFCGGIHYWGVSIARVVEGWPASAVVHFPSLNETYSARAGGGAQFNGLPLVVSPKDENHISFFTRDSRLFQKFRARVPLKPRILGSAAYNFCAVARGVSVLGFETTPKVWDFAGSWLVLHEAGGVTHVYGPEPFPLEPGIDYEKVEFPILAAQDRSRLDQFREMITPRTEMNETAVANPITNSKI